MIKPDVNRAHSASFEVRGTNYEELDVQAKAVCLAYFGDRKVRYSVSASPKVETSDGTIALWEGRVSAFLEDSRIKT